MTLSGVYDKDFLEKIQGEILKMLLEVDRICKKHGIKYYLGGGTLLGAVRHKGFIPWDDDADIFFLRDDYEKFRSVVEEELLEQYFFQDTKTDPGAHYIYSKIRLNDSLYVTKFGDTQNMHKGIFLDIFVHDATSNHYLARKWHILKTHYVRAMQVASLTGKRYKKKLPLVGMILDSKLNKHDTRYWDEQVYKTVTKYKKLSNPKYSYDGIGEHLSHGVFSYKYFGTPKLMDFCGYKLPVPEMYKEYLEFSYGPDYMTLPPEEKRHPDHSVVRIKFPGEEEMHIQ